MKWCLRGKGISSPIIPFSAIDHLKGNAKTPTYRQWIYILALNLPKYSKAKAYTTNRISWVLRRTLNLKNIVCLKSRHYLITRKPLQKIPDSLDQDMIMKKELGRYGNTNHPSLNALQQPIS